MNEHIYIYWYTKLHLLGIVIPIASTNGWNRQASTLEDPVLWLQTVSSTNESSQTNVYPFWRVVLSSHPFSEDPE